MARPRILVVALELALCQRLVPTLERNGFEVDRVTGGRSALALAGRIGFNLLLAGYPLADLAVDELLAKLRRDGSPCQATLVVLVTSPDQMAAARAHLRGGVDHVFSSAMPESLQIFVSRLLDVQPRAAARAAVRLKAQLGGRTAFVLAQTQDVSATGMLVRTAEPPPVGTTVAFELSVAEDQPRVRGEATVVRHVSGEGGTVIGAGLRFLSLDAEGQKRLAAYVEQRLPV